MPPPNESEPKYQIEAVESYCRYTRDGDKPVPLKGYRIKNNPGRTVYECPVRSGACPLLIGTCKYEFVPSPKVVNSGNIDTAKMQAGKWYNDKSQFIDILFQVNK